MDKYNNFINYMLLPLSCENSEAIFLVLVGLVACSLAGWQSDEILEDLNFITLSGNHIVSIFTIFNVSLSLICSNFY